MTYKGWYAIKPKQPTNNLIFMTVLWFYINLWVNLFDMFNKHKFKSEMFVAISCCYGKLCMSIVRGTVLLVDGKGLDFSQAV